MSTSAEKLTILKALQSGELDLQGQFLLGSNYTFLCRLSTPAMELVAVYKPGRGEQPLWDFPQGTLVKREVAAYAVSESLGWELVPPTVYRRRKLPLGPGSLQQYVEHDPEYHYFRFSPEDKQRLRPVALFDLLINNADRKGGHVLRDPDGHLWLIDHGVCFHEEDKLRTVIWDFAGEAIPDELLADVQRLAVELECEGSIAQELNKWLYPAEIRALMRRAQRVLSTGIFPYPAGSRRPYPWPPV